MWRRVLWLPVALGVGAGFGGCGDNTMKTSVTSASQARVTLEEDDYRPAEERGRRAPPFLAFSFQPQYGHLVGTYTRGGLTMLPGEPGMSLTPAGEEAAA